MFTFFEEKYILVQWITDKSTLKVPDNLCRYERKSTWKNLPYYFIFVTIIIT